MQWCRFQVGEKISYGIVENGQVTVVDGLPWEKHTVTATRYELAQIKILLPVIPPTFYCVGINYRDHIIKSAQRKGVEPVFPKKPDIGYRANNALCAHEEPIIKPADSGEMFQYEGELVAVIGKQGKKIPKEKALEYVFGWTMGNDVSERTWQKADRTLWRAKNCDSFKPMGPFITTGLDPMDLTVSIDVNGQRAASYHTGKMLFSAQHFIAKITQYSTLHPGDVIWLGTDDATIPDLKHGDTVDVICDPIGVLSNPVVRAKA